MFVSIHAPAQGATIQERHRIIAPGTLPERSATGLGPLPMPHGVYAHRIRSATTSEDIGRQPDAWPPIALPPPRGIIGRYGITRASSIQPSTSAVRPRGPHLRLPSLRVLMRGRRCPLFRVCRYPATREIYPRRAPPAVLPDGQTQRSTQDCRHIIERLEDSRRNYHARTVPTD